MAIDLMVLTFNEGSFFDLIPTLKKRVQYVKLIKSHFVTNSEIS
jgi:hypothetical protein